MGRLEIPGASDTAAMEDLDDDGGLARDVVVGVAGSTVAMDVDLEGSGVSVRRGEVRSDGVEGQEGR